MSIEWLRAKTTFIWKKYDISVGEVLNSCGVKKREKGNTLEYIYNNMLGVRFFFFVVYNQNNFISFCFKIYLFVTYNKIFQFSLVIVEYCLDRNDLAIRADRLQLIKLSNFPLLLSTTFIFYLNYLL